MRCDMCFYDLFWKVELDKELRHLRVGWNSLFILLQGTSFKLTFKFAKPLFHLMLGFEGVRILKRERLGNIFEEGELSKGWCDSCDTEITIPNVFYSLLSAMRVHNIIFNFLTEPELHLELRLYPW